MIGFRGVPTVESRKSRAGCAIPAMQSEPFPTGPRGTAIVTGASHRVGRAIALELARRGLGLVLTFRSRAEACRETARLAVEAARAEGLSIGAAVHELDLSDAAAAVRFADRVAADCDSAGGVLDAIVHNASGYEPTPLESLDAPSVESALRVEVSSPLAITVRLRAALSRSRLPGGGAVVFFSDAYAIGRARPGYTGYMVAKSAVAALSRQLAVELAPSVRVHCVAPGVILWPEGFAEDAKRAILARTPLGRAGTAEEAARLVRFLITEASFMTGGSIEIDGGRMLR